MKRLVCTLAALVAALPLWAAPVPARANAFCPATVAALTDLGQLGRADTFGVLLDVDRGDTRSVRLRIDSDRTRYALDVNDIPLMVYGGLQLVRYFTLPLGERVLGAWVESTGLGPAQRLDCPVTAPWGTVRPQSASPVDAQNADRQRRTLLDDFGTRTLPVITPVAFGAVQSITCAQPNGPARILTPVRPAFPPEARAVNATGAVELRADIEENGTLIGAAVTRSSGFAPLDRAALETAKRARYAAATFACHPVATSLTFTTGFGT
jgi:TonB family protein